MLLNSLSSKSLLLTNTYKIYYNYSFDNLNVLFFN